MSEAPNAKPTPRYEWERLVRRAKMPRAHKFLAFVLATYADPDGSRVRPGNEVLAAVTDQSERSVKRSLAALRSLGFLTVARRGGGRSGTGKATTYQLSIPVDLMEMVELLGPGETPDSGATQVACQTVESPVDRSVDNPVDNGFRPNESEATQMSHENDFQGPNFSIEGPPGWPTTNTHLPTTKDRPSVVTSQGDYRPRGRTHLKVVNQEAS